MNKLLILIFSILFVSCSAQQHSIMTYNIRLDVKSDGENAWPNRKDFLLNQVKFYEPDILGTQEGLPHQIKFLNENLDHYKFIGEGRDGGNKGEYTAIFYNSEKLKIIDQGTFWLSETPEKISKGWNSAYIRICTYGLFQNTKTKEKFWVFNTHLDNKGQEARLQSVDLIAQKIMELNVKKYPFIVTGDFNVEPNDEVIKKFEQFTQDSKMMSTKVVFGPNGTFNGFQFSEPVERRIDYIMFGKGFGLSVEKYGVLSDSKDLKYPSDHLPVYVEFNLKDNSNE
ncbi:endonuclease/exonuclease/phosphatase family protein [Gillisia sp. CAL575]|uniref:endonuclease/exonuclease/phosphatase family protein n=1 Tax=Gillisia sp. CAL575 TaxID=985255 RepID=UPI00054F1049|nr:endonuclease/exonuclease/phosphatase family protein [Gillisia sp. CAL575]